MDKLTIGLWGCFFGTTALMLAGAALAFARSLHRIAINAALSALVSAFFAVAFLDLLPISSPQVLARFLAHVVTGAGVVLAYLLLAVLGILRSASVRIRLGWTLAGYYSLATAAGWLLQPRPALALGLASAFLLGCLALVVCLRSALRGDRLARSAIVGVIFLLLALGGLGWIALDRAHVPPQVRVAAALAATVYLTTMAFVLLARYFYLIELHAAMASGPSYDPVTRLRSHAETGQLIGAVFKSFRDDPAPLGVMVLTIANLYALEKLHGAVAINHALFVTAGRLRRAVPAHIDMGRLGHDGFLLILRACKDSGRLIRLARTLQERLHKPLALSTSGDAALQESGDTVWVAEIGIGLLLLNNPAIRGPNAISMARGMSRTAMSYTSRIAWFDHSSSEIVELPLLAPA